MKDEPTNATTERSSVEGLEERLLEAALTRLAQGPAERLSLRQVAHDLGVSHQAPYVHFGSKRGFLAAVAGAGLHAALGEAVEAVDAAGSAPRERLHALADAYLDFIRGRPHVHDLVYGPTVAKSDHARLQQAAIGYWELLTDTVARCQPDGTSPAVVLERSAVVWGTVYGIARLVAFRQIPLAVGAGPDELVHASLDVLFDGWHRMPGT